MRVRVVCRPLPVSSCESVCSKIKCNYSLQSRLESKLCKLYKNMVCLNEMLQHQPSLTSVVLTSEHISQPIRDRLAGHVTTVTDMLRDCSEDLLSLSVLYPAAPWVRFSWSHYITANRACSRLSVSVNNRKSESETRGVW